MSRRNVRTMNSPLALSAAFATPHAHGGYLFIHFLRENAVLVVNELSIRMTAWECLPELLRGPFRRRVGGHIVMKDSSGAQLDDSEYIQPAERCGDHNEEIAGSDPLGMVADEGQPTLLWIGRARRSTTAQVPSNARGDTRRPSFSFNSLAIRSSPHVTFAAAIAWIRWRKSFGN